MHKRQNNKIKNKKKEEEKKTLQSAASTRRTPNALCRRTLFTRKMCVYNFHPSCSRDQRHECRKKVFSLFFFTILTTPQSGLINSFERPTDFRFHSVFTKRMKRNTHTHTHTMTKRTKIFTIDFIPDATHTLNSEVSPRLLEKNYF